MSLRRQVMGALAWAGLVFVIAVPSAEVVRSKLLPGSTGEVASVAPAAPAIKADDSVAPKPAANSIAVTPKAPTQVRSVPPTQAVPASAAEIASTDESAAAAVPADPIKDYLASGKPLPDYIKSNSTAKPAAAAAQTLAVVPQSATVAGTPVSPAPKSAVAKPKPQPGPAVTEADLKDWKSGTLEDYLRQKGLLSGSSDATVRGN